MDPDMSQSPAPVSSRPAADPVFQQRAAAAALMTLIGLFGLFGGYAASIVNSVQRGVYPIGAAIVIGIVAIWLAVTSLTRARRLGSARPRGAIFAIVVSAIAIALGALMLLGFAELWPQMTQLSQCESGANTITAHDSCYQQFMSSTGVKEIKLMRGTKS